MRDYESCEEYYESYCREVEDDDHDRAEAERQELAMMLALTNESYTLPF